MQWLRANSRRLKQIENENRFPDLIATVKCVESVQKTIKTIDSLVLNYILLQYACTSHTTDSVSNVNTSGTG